MKLLERQRCKRKFLVSFEIESRLFFFYFHIFRLLGGLFTFFLGGGDWFLLGVFQFQAFQQIV